MLTIFIQFCFFLFISTTTHAMKKNDQRAIVRSLLDQNNEKLINWDLRTTSKTSTRTPIEPLPNIFLNHSTIKTSCMHHVQPLSRKFHANYCTFLIKHGKNDQALAIYKKIAPCVPDDLSILSSETRPAYASMHNSVQEIALNGNDNAQKLFTAHNIQRISPLFKEPDFLAKIKDQSCSYAFELLDFTLNIKNKNIPIAVTEDSKKELISLRDIFAENDPVTSCLIRTILYLQATTDGQKHIRLQFLDNHDCSDNPEIKAVCQFLINYGDGTLSPEDVVKKFIATITAEKDFFQLLSKIMHLPLYPKVMSKLETVSLANKDPLFQDFNYVMAEFYYLHRNYDQAKKFYTNNKLSYLKAKKASEKVFTAYLAHIENIDKKDITYLSSLFDNIYDHLKTVGKTDKGVSYGVGLLSKALLENNKTLKSAEKITLLLNGLEHLTYAQKNTKLTIKFHALLSQLYEETDDHISSLKHPRQALPHHELSPILEQIEKNNPEEYNRYVCVIKTILQCITNQEICASTKNYTLLSEFASSDSGRQLLPYCQTAYERHKENKKKIHDDITFLMAYAYKDNKALKTIFKKFIKNKKLSSHKKTVLDEQEMIISLLPSIDFFVQKNNHQLALELITLLSKVPDMPLSVIHLAFYVENSLIKSKSDFFKEWGKGLKQCKFYDKFKEPAYYDATTNVQIGLMLQQKDSISYEKITQHLQTALASNALLPETAAEIKEMCGTLYCDWSTSILRQDKKRSAELLDIAVERYNCSEARYCKATFIRDFSDDKDLIHQALKLLEENITTHSSVQAASRLQLAFAYLNVHPNPARKAVLKQFIPLDVGKAMTYLQNHGNDKKLLCLLANIYSGTIPHVDADGEKQYEKYLDIEKAFECINTLIELHPDDINYIAHRMYLYNQLNKQAHNTVKDYNYARAIEDIDLILSKENVSNTGQITRENLLYAKIKFLFSQTLHDSQYSKAFACINELTSLGFEYYPVMEEEIVKKATQNLITTKNMSDSAITWCCAMAITRLKDQTKLSQKATQEEKNLALYLVAAAKMDKFYPQLLLLPYLNAIGYIEPKDYDITEVLSYAYKALSNPQADKQEELTCLLDVLHNLTEEGIAFAYYILCYYYRNDCKKLEEVMLLFNKAKEQDHYLEDHTGTVEKICDSCKKIFENYIEKYTNHPQKQELTAIATFTLGSMCHYSNQQERLAVGLLYITSAGLLLCNELKLPQYCNSVPLLLGSIYYKSAFLKSGIIDHLEQLRKSAQQGYILAAHKMAELYIQQKKDGTTALAITEKDFLPLLSQDEKIGSSNQCSQRSHELIQEYKALQSTTENSDQSSLEYCKRMIKYPDYTEKSPSLIKACQAFQEKKLLEAHNLLNQAAFREGTIHSIACMIFANDSIGGIDTKKNYSLSRYYVENALFAGVDKQQFHSEAFVRSLCDYIQILIKPDPAFNQKPCPWLTKQKIILLLQKQFEQNGIKQEDFYKLFQQETSMDLSTEPEWTDAKSNPKMKIFDNLYNTVCATQNNNATEYKPEELEKLYAQASQKAPVIETIAHDNPAQCIKVAFIFLAGTAKKIDYALSEFFLMKSLANGFMNNKFCNVDYVDTLFTYLETLITQPEHAQMKNRLLPIIKKELEKNSINFTSFKTLFKETTGINLSEVLAWNYNPENTTLFDFCEIRNNSNVIMIETNDPNDPALDKFLQVVAQHDSETTRPLDIMNHICILAVDKDMIRYPNYKENSQAYVYARSLATEDRIDDSIRALQKIKNHPCASMSLAHHNLQKDTKNAEKLLTQALDNGLCFKDEKKNGKGKNKKGQLSKKKQFHNAIFLKTLLDYIEGILILEDDNLSSRLFSILKTKLTEGDINLNDFRDFVQTITKKDLTKIPGWATEQKTAVKKEPEVSVVITPKNEKDKADKEKMDLFIKNAAQKNMIKDVHNKSTDVHYKTGLQYLIDDNKKDAVTYLQKSVDEEHNACACMILATNYLTGKDLTEKNYNNSKELLKKAFEYGLIPVQNSSSKQFCTALFLNYLCMYLEELINKEHPASTKATFLSLIKTTLVDNDIQIHDFWKLLKEYFNIDLDSIPEWITEQESILIQHPRTQETPLYYCAIAIQNAIPTQTKNNIEKASKLMVQASNIEHSPSAYISLASYHLVGVIGKKDYLHIEQLVRNSLKYGLTKQYFCNDIFLVILCGFIENLISKPHDQILKQKLLTIIRTALDEHNINLPVFYEVFQQNTTQKDKKVDFSKVPGWNV